MPSFFEAMGVIAMFIGLSMASGHGDVIWKVIPGARRVAITNARQDWGSPSLFAGRAACSSYHSARYR